MIKQYLKSGLIILIPLLALSSCSDSFYNCIEGNGIMVLETRDKEGFIDVTSSGSFDVHISYSPVYSVTVHADENLQTHIRTLVVGDELIIETDRGRCLRSRNNIYVEVGMPDLSVAELEGSGNMSINNFDVPSMDVRLTGSGNIDVNNCYAGNLNAYLDGSGEINLSGEARTVNYRLTGSGDIMAVNYIVDNCYVTLLGSGTIEVYALEILDVVLTGSGDVYYYGNPVLTYEITGSGDIIHR